MAGRLSKRQIAYNKDLELLIADYNGTMEAYTAKVFQLLKEADQKLKVKILTISEENWLKMNLREIANDIENIMEDFVRDYDAMMLRALRDSANAGTNIIAQPLKNNLDISTMLIEPRVFSPMAMDTAVRRIWNISHSLITNVTQETARKIVDKISIGMLTAEPRYKIIDSIVGELGGKKLGFSTLNSRGWAIYRTETSRMFSNASAIQMAQTAEFLPEGKKQWHHGVMSGLGQHPRSGHMALDGEIIEMDESFVNPRTGMSLRFPHDPMADASEVVNCGCVHTFVMPDDTFLKSNTMVNV